MSTTTHNTYYKQEIRQDLGFFWFAPKEIEEELLMTLWKA
jgi:hypothetical protein